ncbi:hypothetical protein FGO68_gene15215 [Halteria grandinella]|uniref:Uncharacterized protein n=1 Tax=Halteria grandinella TaxID=5974 RepID=A0A8J8NFY6_HALGN|nr:hypothetical protein FGO68_gene15215 [Halteria grandinella]
MEGGQLSQPQRQPPLQALQGLYHSHSPRRNLGLSLTIASPSLRPILYQWVAPSALPTGIRQALPQSASPLPSAKYSSAHQHIHLPAHWIEPIKRLVQHQWALTHPSSRVQWWF